MWNKKLLRNRSGKNSFNVNPINVKLGLIIPRKASKRAMKSSLTLERHWEN